MHNLRICAFLRGYLSRPRRASSTQRSAFLLLLPVAFFAGSAGAADAQPNRYCVDVEVDGQREAPLECLTEQLQAAAGAASPAAANAAPDALGRGEPNRVGTFSFAAASERMGANFGHSVFPQRPQAPVFANTFSGGR